VLVAEVQIQSSNALLAVDDFISANGFACQAFVADLVQEEWWDRVFPKNRIHEALHLRQGPRRAALVFGIARESRISKSSRGERFQMFPSCIPSGSLRNCKRFAA
jgi:hypothetical protein